ncbi:ATP-binding cassette domain-containing protein, partial [Staphylococcus massiliensis]
MELKQVSKTYNQNTVLDQIDYKFDDSRIVGLIGKNGVGKTTLMKVMNGNIINYQGDVITSDDENIGYLIEHPKLYANKSGMYNLKFFSKVLGKGFDKDYTNRIIE